MRFNIDLFLPLIWSCVLLGCLACGKNDIDPFTWESEPYPIDGKIVFSSGDRIYVIDQDGEESIKKLEQLSNGLSTWAKHLRWSPDGSQVVFVRVGISLLNPAIYLNEIQIISSNGFGQVTLVRDSTALVGVDWSPDGKQIVYSRTALPWSGGALIVLDLENLTERKIADGLFYGLDWSPVSQNKILVSTENNIYLFNLETSTTTKLTNTEDLAYQRWSRNGSKIAFASNDSIFVMNSDGSALRFLVEGYHPTWSPDDLAIAYHAQTDFRYDIRLISLDGMLDTVVAYATGSIRSMDWH
jgi:Tol biopolymer transport system component